VVLQSCGSGVGGSTGGISLARSFATSGFSARRATGRQFSAETSFVGHLAARTDPLEGRSRLTDQTRSHGNGAGQVSDSIRASCRGTDQGRRSRRGLTISRTSDSWGVRDAGCEDRPLGPASADVCWVGASARALAVGHLSVLDFRSSRAVQ